MEILLARKRADIAVAGDELKLHLRGSLPDEPFVGVAVFAAQTVIEVGDHESPMVL